MSSLSQVIFASLSSPTKTEKKSAFLNSPVGVKNKSLVYVSHPTKDSAEEGFATGAPSQSLPKTMLEGDTD